MFAWKRSFQLVVSLTVFGLLLAAVGCISGGGGTDSGPIQLQGAGATFPNPLYQKWLSDYGKQHQNVKIDYQSDLMHLGRRRNRFRSNPVAGSGCYFSQSALSKVA